MPVAPDEAAPAAPRRARKAARSRSRRRPAAHAGKEREPTPFGDVSDQVTDEPQPELGAGEAAIKVSETELARAFYWAYQGWCRLLGAPLSDARYTEFLRPARAWIRLARRVPHIRLILEAVAPLVTITELIDKVMTAWAKRTRFRERLQVQVPSWAQRRKPEPEQPTDGQVDPTLTGLHGGNRSA